MSQTLQQQFAQCMVSHCAPVLAGLKSANLINFPVQSAGNFLQILHHYQELLTPKGISIRILFHSPTKALVYLYREKLLQQQWQQQGTAIFLKQFGYPKEDFQLQLLHLQRRIAEQEQFPHEIGVFLGYPLPDVIGFMENHGKNSCCSGLWKVYANPEAAQKLFSKCKKCTAAYCRLFQSGYPISQLAVAV